MKSRPLIPLLAANFISTLGFSIVIPFLVFLVMKFGGNSVLYGVMGAVYPAFQLIGSPFLGKWSDIYGRKKILLICMIGSVIGWMIFYICFLVPVKPFISLTLPIAGTLLITLPVFFIFLGRALDGITGGDIAVANAYLADITSEKDRNKNYGKLSISSNLGFIVGPAIAGILGSTSLEERLPVIAAIIICSIAVLLVIFYLPDVKPKESVSDAGAGVSAPAAKTHKISLKDALKLENVPFMLILYFLIFLGFNFFYTAFPVHVIQKLGWSVSRMGIYFSFLSLLMAVVQGPVLSLASKYFSEKVLVITGNLILGTNFLLLYSNNIILIYTAAVLFALGNGLMWPSFLSMLSKVAGTKYQGSVQGFASGAGGIASIIGLILAGFIYQRIGSFTFVISAGIMYFVVLISIRLIKVKC